LLDIREISFHILYLLGEPAAKRQQQSA